MIRNPFTRRTFLRGAGGVALSLPLLEALSTGRAFGQTTSPKRLVIFMHPQGVVMNSWRPSGSATNFQLGEILSPLEPHKSDIVVVNGVDNDVNQMNQLSNGHNSAARTLLTCEPFAQNVNPDGSIRPRQQQVENGYANGPSIDQVIASRIGANNRFRTVDLAVGGSQTDEVQLFHAGRNDPVVGQADPRTVFTRLFSDLPTTDPGGGGGPITAIDRLHAQRRSILDTVRQSFGQAQSRASAADRARLEAHADKIRELEQSIVPITTPPSAACAAPTVTVPGGYNPTSDRSDNVSAENLIDEAVMALACDLTRVVTIQFTQYQGNTFPWLGVNIPDRWANWHTMIHEARSSGGGPAMISAMRWYSEMFARLLAGMKAVQEPDGSLLDNTLVMWVSDFGDGAGHGTWDLPYVFAGRYGGAFPTGRNLNLNGRTGELYTSMLNVMGFNDATFGRTEYCRGPIAGFV